MILLQKEYFTLQDVQNRLKRNEEHLSKYTIETVLNNFHDNGILEKTKGKYRVSIYDN